MSKAEFLNYLSEKLKDMPESEAQKSLGFYSEIIDDRIEDGMSEEEAVAALGDPDAIVREILLDLPLKNLVKAKFRTQESLRGGQILLIILGFPLWFPLLCAFGATILAVYVTVWSLIIALWASVAGFALTGVAGFVGGIIQMFAEGVPGLLVFGVALVSAGIALLSFFGVKELTRWLIKLTASFLRWVKSFFIRKERFN